MLVDALNHNGRSRSSLKEFTIDRIVQHAHARTRVEHSRQLCRRIVLSQAAELVARSESPSFVTVKAAAATKTIEITGADAYHEIRSLSIGIVRKGLDPLFPANSGSQVDTAVSSA